jgi:hypothetical protein
MEYRVAVDIAEAGYKNWSFPAFGLIFVVIGGVLVLTRNHWPDLLWTSWWSKHPRVSKAFSVLFLGFAVLWTVTSFAATFFEYRSLKLARENGQAQVVEGTVKNFVAMPATGHAMEKFCVREACFQYSDFAITAGFNNTASHGGPIKDGLPVRVTYVGGAIVKLEVAK